MPRKNMPAGPGRPKGSKNKFNADIRTMILQSLSDRGGIRWLNSLPDPEFCRLASRVIPQNLDANVGGSIVVEIVTSGDGKPEEK